MTTDLDLTLREAGSDLHLATPLADVLSRGDRIRRRGQLVRIIGAGTVLTATAGVVMLALPPGTTPIPAAEAGWGPAMVNRSGAGVADADARCQSHLKGMAPELPADVAPLAADSRGGTAVLVYRVGDIVNTCSLSTHPEGGAAFLSTGMAWQLPEAHHIGHLTAGGASPSHTPQEILDGQTDDPVTDGVEVLRVSDEVAKVVLHVAGHHLEARVGDGLAVSWVPDGTLRSELEAATATAYAADGSELETRPLLPTTIE